MDSSRPTLAIGTAQWGLDYGIANRAGQPTIRSIRSMVEVALSTGIDTFDTARAYGTSEAALGQALDSIDGEARIVTKLDPQVWGRGVPCAAAVERAKGSVRASCEALRVSRIDTILLHRGVHRLCCDGAVWDWLQNEVRGPIATRLGVSAATPDEAMALVAVPDIDVIQVPASIVDQRLERRGFFDLAARSGTEVHVRSVYLQGVAHLDPGAMPGHLQSLRPAILEISGISARLGVPVGVVWLLYARTLPVSRLVIGIETVEQLIANVNAFEREIPPEIGTIGRSIPLADDRVLDPAKWPA